MKDVIKKSKKIAEKGLSVNKTPVSHGVGRRKSSTARVWLRNGDGKITINTKNFESYFHTDVSQRAVLQPLDLTGTMKDFNIDVNVSGGGIHSQADAVKLGISRALLKYQPSYKEILKSENLLTVDSRVKERKKYGQKGARRKFQFVKR
jgi:small subunit ribosomal protein S9